MPWVRLKGIEGMLWEPDKQPASEKKHNCRDCDWCQMCSDTRCVKCRQKKTKSRRKDKS